MPTVDERHVRVVVGIFGALGIALSVGRSLWFWFRHGKRPIARPRNARERVWHRAFVATVAGIFLVCFARFYGHDAYRFCIPLENLETRIGLAVALTVIVAGFAFALVAQSQMGASWRIGVPDERTQLVTGGLYNHVRNPIYGGFLGAMVGFAILLPSLASAVLLTSSHLILRAWVEIEEERQTEIHGDAYRQYCQRTGRFFPRLTRSPRPRDPRQ